MNAMDTPTRPRTRSRTARGEPTPSAPNPSPNPSPNPRRSPPPPGPGTSPAAPAGVDAPHHDEEIDERARPDLRADPSPAGLPYRRVPRLPGTRGAVPRHHAAAA